MNMSEDDPRRMDEIRKYAAIYGRFDCKRKPEKPLTLHEVSRSVLIFLVWVVQHDSLPPVTDTPFTYSEIPSIFKQSVMSVCPFFCIHSYALREQVFFFVLKFYVNVKLKPSVWRIFIPRSRKSGVQKMFRSFFTSALDERECAASENTRVWTCWSV
jgi:hypothetical protein